MSKGKFQKRSVFPKGLAVLLALTLVVGAAVGGTVAWLTAQSDEVTNTFTVGNIEIDLNETENLDLKMIPGHTIAKDPKVSVTDKSEDCWLFVEITESENLDDFIVYATASGWETVVEENDGVTVIGRKVLNADTTREFSVLAEDKVTVSGEVTKDMMDAIDDGTATEPTLAFKAYACQLNNGTRDYTAAEAWALAKPTT